MQLKEKYVRNLIIRYFASRLNCFKNVWKSLNTGFLNIQGKGADKNIHTPLEIALKHLIKLDPSSFWGSFPVD